MTATLDPLTFQVDHHTDLWIARRVMEWPVISEHDRFRDYLQFGGVIVVDRPEIFRYGTIPELFQPSSKMEDAMEVIHKMRVKGWWYSMGSDPKNKSTVVVFGRALVNILSSADAETEPLAVCRAAGVAVISEDK